MAKESSWREFAPPVQCAKGSPFKIIDENYRYLLGGQGYFDIENPDDHFCISGMISPRNTRLMAAAPELLEELEIAERHIRILVEIVKGKRRSDRREVEAIDEHGIQRSATIRRAKGQS